MKKILRGCRSVCAAVFWIGRRRHLSVSNNRLSISAVLWIFPTRILMLLMIIQFSSSVASAGSIYGYAWVGNGTELDIFDSTNALGQTVEATWPAPNYFYAKGRIDADGIYAYANANVPNGNSSLAYFHAMAQMELSDSIVIGGGTGSGLVTFTFESNGQVGTEYSDGAFRDVQVWLRTSGQIYNHETTLGDNQETIIQATYSGQFWNYSDWDNVLSITAPYSFGQSLDLKWTFSALVGMSEPLIEPFSFSGFADAWGSSRLIGIYLKGTDFAADNLYVSSELGMNYPTPEIEQVIPEPTSLLLLSTGLGLVGLAAWRRRK